ncbi:MAG: tRNA (adenosine(37)-N6)-threonylcarbamoyltransferase complex ATPase subunit type 1 TsaE [Patescibacteria group bacterium]
MNTVISHSLEETKEIAKKWLAEISADNYSNNPDNFNDSFGDFSNEAVVVGLCGPLGSGKTAFVQAIAEALGVKKYVTSPTFVLMKIYEIDSDLRAVPWKRLVHIDAYRLEKPEEVGALDFESIVSDQHNLVLIEWADNIEKALPQDWKRIDFETLGEDERSIAL